MNSNEAFVLVSAIVAGALVLAFLIRYGAQVVRGPAAGEAAGGNALTQGEVEGMIRRAVREEVRPLREKIERLEEDGAGSPFEKAPRRDLPDGRDDPHDFGLIAEAPGGSEHAAPHEA